MEAVNAPRLTPLSVLSDRRNEPRKTPFFPAKKKSISSSISANGSALSRNTRAKALTYEEALDQSMNSAGTDFAGASGVLETVANFARDNPVFVAGSAAILAAPLIVSQLLRKPKPWGIESAKTAYGKMGEDANAQLLDIRPPREVREVGRPDITGLKKKAVTVSYDCDDKSGFLKKLSLKFKEPKTTTLLILDKYDGSSELVAELVTANGFKAAYAIKDGAEGWMSSGLPWIPPKRTLSLELISNITDVFGDALGEGGDAVTAGLGVAAAAGLGVLAFTEVETILQLLGSAAIVQVFSKKFLFAEDRKQTLQQVDEFLNTKIAPKELVDEIKQIGKALLPTPVITSKALPSPAEAKNARPEEEEEEVTSASSSQPTPLQLNSVVKPEAPHSTPKPLSPYPNYPDYKPPSSPMPSQP
ncbi:hypothetical protein DM860_004673 [Cuscuta australis]|uniref:Rhodanese domain-containing protein n=1 Tax=Cuscuta australis TaxID=267555 RepID=A0A328E8F1_9ASTE|nr:hypothetical protein DM860_004673 [Cuscuta australis]